MAPANEFIIEMIKTQEQEMDSENTFHGIPLEEPVMVPVEYKEGLTAGDAAGIRREALLDSFSTMLDEVRTLGNALQSYKTHEQKIEVLRQLGNKCDYALAINAELNK
jgi:hypothetical protein